MQFKLNVLQLINKENVILYIVRGITSKGKTLKIIYSKAECVMSCETEPHTERNHKSYMYNLKNNYYDRKLQNNDY